MLVSSHSYYVLGAQDASGGMRYLVGPIAICDDVTAAQPFVTVELARAALPAAVRLSPQSAWSVLRAERDLRLSPIEHPA